MSLTITKAGILDTVQDCGRYGYQSVGINPGGAMDRFSARLANCLLGKPMDAAVIEFHFPASTIRFDRATVICITGADFSPVINNGRVPLNQPIAVAENSVLQFTKIRQGARCYLALLQDLEVLPWLHSFSTNLRAEAGGMEGRSLSKGDVIGCRELGSLAPLLEDRKLRVLPWLAQPAVKTAASKIGVIAGPEFNRLTDESKQAFSEATFRISKVADRMGYRLTGPALQVWEQSQLVSSGVSFGTIQLLPNGHLIVLMADHQTTGGYPRVGNVISAHLPVLAQMKPNDEFIFEMTGLEAAELQLFKQQQYLLSVQHAASFKIQNLLR